MMELGAPRMLLANVAFWHKTAERCSPVMSANFHRVVREILFHTGLSPYRLELEITETALVRDLNRAISTLRHLKTLGVRIAMDDFETGYSSLSNLHTFPFDKIKIDGSFVKSADVNEQTAAIVRAVLGLGRGLGLPVLAEGVETAGELKFLREELCDEAQGYHLGRPAEIEIFRELTHGERPSERPSVTALETWKLAVVR
jgi:diguanylate cyclase